MKKNACITVHVYYNVWNEFQDNQKSSADESSSSSDTSHTSPPLAPNDAAAKILASVARKASAAAASRNTKKESGLNQGRHQKGSEAASKSKGQTMNQGAVRLSTSDDDDVETSLSDELSQSWPTKKISQVI